MKLWCISVKESTAPGERQTNVRTYEVVVCAPDNDYNNIPAHPDNAYTALHFDTAVTDEQQPKNRTYEELVIAPVTDYENMPAHPDNVYTALHLITAICDE